MRLAPTATFVASALVALFCWGAASEAYADLVITNDEASADYLAGKISLNSGISSEEYDHYASKLSPEQQSRVFKDVQVGGGVGGDGEPAGGDDGETYSEEEIEDIRAFVEFLTGGQESSWNGESKPWWWDLFQEIFQFWLANQSGGGRR